MAASDLCVAAGYITVEVPVNRVLLALTQLRAGVAVAAREAKEPRTWPSARRALELAEASRAMLKKCRRANAHQAY